MIDLDQELLNGKILIIEDDPTNLLLLERTLQDVGYTAVIGTTDPRIGVDICRRQSPDLLLLDLRMPHMDGFQVMDALKHITDNDFPPIIVLTAQTDVQTRLKALDGGARDFINKPIERTEMLSRIRNQLEVRLAHNRLRDQKSLLETMIMERTRELADTRLDIVRRLGRAAEYRDNETGLHTIRMSKMAAALAHKAGLPNKDVELILNASPMHDIGKIGIPDVILLKKGKLTPEEWSVMQTHTTIGNEILSGHDSELLVMAREIALHHHEKWDGTGYPHGLKGERIPLSARIAAIADVFDALTSERPYKQAWTAEQAVTQIRHISGSHLDSDLVQLFLEILPEVLSISKQYAEPKRAEGLRVVSAS